MISGSVVRDPGLKSLRGRFLYEDFCAGRLRSFVPALPGGATDDKPIGLRIPRGGIGYPALNGFGTDAENRIYLFSQNGSLYRLTGPGPLR